MKAAGRRRRRLGHISWPSAIFFRASEKYGRRFRRPGGAQKKSAERCRIKFPRGNFIRHRPAEFLCAFSEARKNMAEGQKMWPRRRRRRPAAFKKRAVCEDLHDFFSIYMPFGGRPNHVPRTAQTTFPGRPQTDSGIRATCQVALIRRAQPRPPGGLEPPRAALRAAQLCLSSRSRRRGGGCSARAAPCAPREGGRNHGNAGFA